MRLRHPWLPTVLLLSGAAGVAQAAAIYKSVDANGNVTYSDHVDPANPQSTPVQLDDPAALPTQLHFCWTHCFTLVLDNGAYHRIDGTDESWTVERFSANGVVLHRHDAPADWNGHSPDVVYAGQVSNDRLIGVTINGRPASGVDASWGAALNTLPGNDAERDGTANTTAASAATVSSAVPPPPLQPEDQPPLSEDGALWTPGYWYWRDLRYVWIPGAWLRPPQIGLLWTPGYWRSAGSVYVFHQGYWGSTVGFYGGVNYGHGYFGTGYTGGHWIGNSFAYNSAVNHIDPAIAQHTFSQTRPASGAAQSGQPASAHRSTVQLATARETLPAARAQQVVAKAAAPAGVPKINHPSAKATPLKQ